METNNTGSAQMPLTPENANPPVDVPQTKPVNKRYIIPDVILPAEDEPLQPMEDRRKKRREEYLRDGS